MLQSSNTHLIVILDEVDHLLRRSGDDIIYKLMRIDEDREGVGTLSTIMISPGAGTRFTRECGYLQSWKVKPRQSTSYMTKVD